MSSTHAPPVVRPHCPPFPDCPRPTSLSVQNAAKQKCTRENAAVHKNKQPFASDRALALCRELLGAAFGTTRNVSNPSAVLSNPKHLYLSLNPKCLFLSLSLSGGEEGGLGSQANTFTPTARVEVTLLQKGERVRQRSTK